MKKTIVTDKAPRAVGPYSQAVKAGQYLFISGQIPIHPGSGELVNDEVTNQAVQVLKNIEGILESEGLHFADVVKTTIYLKSMADFPVVNEVYAQYFTEPFPARACIEVSRLPKDVDVEIDAIAYYG